MKMVNELILMEITAFHMYRIMQICASFFVYPH